MADKPNETPEAAARVADAEPVADGHESGAKAKAAAEPDAVDDAAKKAGEAEEPAAADAAKDAPGKDAPDGPAKEEDKPPADADVEMADAPPADAPAPEPAQTPAAKAKTPRRKSGAGESKAKALSKKGSKARLTHIDAQPGDHFLVKLKGFPAWPAIVCDETMLPAALIGSRPVSAARPDGTYAEAYADGGKRAQDRSFPVMYLQTNEFGWVQNTALSELSAEKAKESIAEKMRRDLKAAFELAAEHHDIDHYKQILKTFQEEQEALKQAAATPKKGKKGKGKTADDDDDEAMNEEDADAAPKSAKAKKRKAEEDGSTAQRPDSVKKPKIKLNTSSTPKSANGAGQAVKTSGDGGKSTKTKAKKAKDGGEKKVEAAKDTNMTPEQRRALKEKEVLYLRHKLQRGLLTREQQPREDEMQSMSDYIGVLENFVHLEVSIIRATKINKVLKAILKLESVPREEEFEFKKRSHLLLEKWNKLLAGDASGPPSTATNGVNGAGDDKKSEAEGDKDAAEEAEQDEEPKAAEPNAAEPKAAEPKAAEPKAAESKAAESKVAESKAEEKTADDDATETPAAAEETAPEAVEAGE